MLDQLFQVYQNDFEDSVRMSNTNNNDHDNQAISAAKKSNKIKSQ